GLAENSTIVAQIFGVAALLAYILSLQAVDWKKSLLLFVSAMICGLPIVLSQSRGAALALIAVSFIGLLVVRPSMKIWLPQVAIALIGVVGAIALTTIDEVLEKRGISFSFRDAI